MSPNSVNSRSLEEQFEELFDEDLDSIIRREQSTFDEMAGSLNKCLVLFGAGKLGRKTLAGLRKVGIEPLAFTDNNKQLWNMKVDDLIVFSPQDAAHKYGKNAAFISTVWRAMGGDRHADRCRQLFDLGCQKVIPFGFLFWKYPDIFLPHASLDLPHRLYQHVDELRKVLHLWTDADSRYNFFAQLRFRMLMDFDALLYPSPVYHKQYFPDDLYSIVPGETFIDCGAFDGDTIRELLLRRDDICKIIAFEPDPINFYKLQQYVSRLPSSVQEKIILRQAAVGRSSQKVHFSTTGTVASRVLDTGDLELNSVSLDQEIHDSYPTMIKMDIEGSEVDALYGGSKVIEQALPILAICVYHLPDHFWEIPLIIKSISNNYRFFLRPHDFEGWDLVCYAVPMTRLLSNKSVE